MLRSCVIFVVVCSAVFADVVPDTRTVKQSHRRRLFFSSWPPPGQTSNGAFAVVRALPPIRWSASAETCLLLAMLRSCVIFVVVCSAVFADVVPDTRTVKQIEQLVLQWAPLIWMAPDEKFMPSRVEDFLSNVHAADEAGTIFPFVSQQFLPQNLTQGLYLITNQDLDTLKEDKTSFLYGRNPKKFLSPVYAVVSYCPDQNKFVGETNHSELTPSAYFHVTYWSFYPYNEGKEVCVIGNVPTFSVFGRCLGSKKTMLNHVGDWEHMSLSFEGRPYPKELFLAVHDAGVYYKYEPRKNIFKYDSQVTRKGIVQRPKFPPVVRLEGGHPVLFSACGSHGLWSSPGEHYYVRVPKLTDKNGYGVPWKTWNNVEIYHLGISTLPQWMLFRGKWGNPKSNCFLSKKLGICEYNDGPVGILRDVEDFHCSPK